MKNSKPVNLLRLNTASSVGPVNVLKIKKLPYAKGSDVKIARKRERYASDH